MSLLQTARMDGLLLDKTGNYTIFAPTNDAFDAMDQQYLESVMSDPGQLEMVNEIGSINVVFF